MIVLNIGKKLITIIKHITDIIAVIIFLILIYFAYKAITILKDYYDYSATKATKLEKVVLEITPASLSEKTIISPKDNTKLNGFLNYIFNTKDVHEYNLFRTVKFLDEQSQLKDQNIKGVVINIGNSDKGGLASINELGNAIKAFKERTGVPVIAYLNYIDLYNLYLASFADKIITDYNPTILIRRFSVGTVYKKDFYEKFGVRVQSHRQGQYKSALEYQFENHITPAYQEGRIDFYTNLETNLVQAIGINRKINNLNLILPDDETRISNVEKFGNELIPLLNNKVIDEQVPTGELSTYIENYFNSKNQDNNQDSAKNAPLININDYIYNQDLLAKQEKEQQELTATKNQKNDKESNDKKDESPDKIAFLTLEGAVVTKGNSDLQIVANSVLRTLKNIDPKKYAGVLLRINTGGGSSIAGNKINDAIHYLREVKKIPVVVSQSNTAASAGYNISAASQYIFSNPFTVTGSIGTYIQSVNVHDTLSENLGIDVQTVGGGFYNDPDTSIPFINETGDLSKFEENKKFIYNYIEVGYKGFVSKMARDRGVTYDQIHEVAQGRVWLGNTAIVLHLVDQNGGVLDAYQYLLNEIKNNNKDFDETKVQVDDLSEVYVNRVVSTVSNNSIISFVGNYVKAHALAYQLNVSVDKAYDLLLGKDTQVIDLISQVQQGGKPFYVPSASKFELLEYCEECHLVKEAR